MVARDRWSLVCKVLEDEWLLVYKVVGVYGRWRWISEEVLLVENSYRRDFPLARNSGLARLLIGYLFTVVHADMIKNDVFWWSLSSLSNGGFSGLKVTLREQIGTDFYRSQYRKPNAYLRRDELEGRVTYVLTSTATACSLNRCPGFQAVAVMVSMFVFGRGILLDEKKWIHLCAAARLCTFYQWKQMIVIVKGMMFQR